MLLHGQDWAARRHELESRLLSDFPLLSPDDRAARWAELATLYAATGQAQDAAVCWAHAVWECPVPPEAWLEQWTTAECRAAKRSYVAGDLERWLGEPGRPGTGRVVAALAAQFGFQNTPRASSSRRCRACWRSWSNTSTTFRCGERGSRGLRPHARATAISSAARGGMTDSSAGCTSAVPDSIWTNPLSCGFAAARPPNDSRSRGNG